jgi:effector-binding domain-containing protein
LHEGDWMSIPDSYSLIMQFIAENKLNPTGENRELYLNVDFHNAEANTTLIQIGID